MQEGKAIEKQALNSVDRSRNELRVSISSSDESEYEICCLQPSTDDEDSAVESQGTFHL